MEVVHPEAVPTSRRPNKIDLVAGALLLSTVVLHVVAMFPAYYETSLSHASIASQADQVALYSVLAAGWALVVAVGLTGPVRIPLAAGLAVGLATTELGFRVSDLGDVFRYGTGQAGAGLWLMTAAWVVGAAGAMAAVVAARTKRDSAGPVPSAVNGTGADTDRPLGWTFLAALLGVVTAGAFLPAWDHYQGASTVTGRGVSFNLGNAFSGPWQIVIGNVLVAVALVAVPVGATRWRKRPVGAAAVAGGLVVLAAQFTAAVVQVDQPVSPNLAGLSATQARQLGLVLNMNLTGWFTLDALAALGVLVMVMFWATARPQPANSPEILPSAPDWRSEAMPSPS